MPQQVFGAAAAVSMLNRAFYNASPSNAIFKNQVEQIGTTEESQILFANQFAAGLANVPAQELVEQVLGNMGLLPNDALVEAGVEALEAYGPDMYGAVVLSFAKLIATLENATGEQEIFRDAAKAWNKEVGQSYLYSNNPANTEDFEGDFGGDTPTTGLTLSHGADNLVGGAGDDVFVAPVTQNGTGSGALANTFETGDVIDGGAGHNILRADLIATGTIGAVNEVAISATTKNIQEVYLRQQSPQTDGAVNNSTIDAEKMAGVEQWWTENSRSGIQVEDIRTDTANTAFGMRLTDADVGFNAYFNALFLEGDMTATSAVTLNIYEGPAGSPDAAKQLKDISVREINFKVAGETVSLSSQAIKDADTWDELEVALNEALETVGVADTITVTNRGNGQFVFEDSAAREFQVNSSDALVVAVANNITFTNSLAVGRDEVVGPVVSSAMLDGAGNGGQGGTLNIGAMAGQRGVQELDLSVDRDSHLLSITSTNLKFPVGKPNEFLEVVNLSSTGANGDLTVGNSTTELDGRVATGFNSGFTNLREFNGAGFEGDLNVAFTLNNNVDARYLKNATEAVNFTYTGGAQDDIFNIAATAAISGDKDFAMQVNMGAGDDRLILNVPTVSAVKVDGGTGDNSIVVSQSHGTKADNTFAEFKNFQTYEVEGGADTKHDFTKMGGVESVVVATTGFASTQLIKLEADQDVTISGKNQTVGNNNSTDFQLFNTITLTNDAGADRTITLDNTARLANTKNGVNTDGVLWVNNLTVDTDPVTGVGATKNVTIESNGVRNTANAIGSFNGRDVESLTLTGTQDLTINVREIANQAANLAPGTDTSTSVQINAAGLKGDLNLAIDGTMLNNFGTKAPVPAQVDTIVGTAGANDTAMFYGALKAGNAVRGSGFETVQLGSFGHDGAAAPAQVKGGQVVTAAGTALGFGVGAGQSNAINTMYGDLQMNFTGASGTLNAANLGASNFNIAALDAGITLTGLSSASTVNLGDAARNAVGERIGKQVLVEQINLRSSATTPAETADAININRLGNIASGTTSNIAVGDQVVGSTANTGGFKTINLNVGHDIGQTANESTVSNINLAVGSQARTLNVTGGNSPTNVSDLAQQLAATEVQTLTFTGAANNALNDKITVAGVQVTLTNAASTATQTADDVEADLNAAILAAPAGSLLAGAVVVNDAAGGLTVTYAGALGNVVDNALAVNWGAVDAGAQTSALATTTQGAVALPAVTGQADVLNLNAPLLNSLEKIDLSGFQGQVNLTMQQGAIAGQTDVNFVLSKYNAEITLSDVDTTNAGVTHNSTFDFTGAGSTTVPTQWTVHNVINAQGAGADVNNQTLFDVKDLGIANYAQLKVLYVDQGQITVDAYGRTLNAGEVVIRSEAEHNNGAVTWEIVVDGIVALTGANAATQLHEANFGF